MSVKRRIGVASLAAGGLLMIGAATAEATADKVWVCHVTGSSSNPFVLIHVAASAADGEGKNDHTLHQGDLIEGRDGDAATVKAGCVKTPPPTSTSTTGTSTVTVTTPPTSTTTTEPPTETSTTTEPTETTTTTVPVTSTTTEETTTTTTTAAGPSTTVATGGAEISQPEEISTSDVQRRAAATSSATELAFTGPNLPLAFLGAGLLGLGVFLTGAFRRGTH
jgi:hypothetical protein